VAGRRGGGNMLRVSERSIRVSSKKSTENSNPSGDEKTKRSVEQKATQRSKGLRDFQTGSQRGPNVRGCGGNLNQKKN